MKKSKVAPILALVLTVFFLLNFTGEIFYANGRGKKPEKGMTSLKLAMKLFPLSSAYAGEAGFALLEKGTQSGNMAPIKESIAYFKAAIRKNLLDYQSRYYLAKAYLQVSAVDNDYFDLGVAELKRAARIRGSNKQVVLDCVKVFFSLWPLLEEEDQEFASQLLSGVMPTLSWAEFSPLLEMWSLYVQDMPLLMEHLQLQPAFFGPAANQLIGAGIPIEQRHEMLATYEAYVLDTLERRYDELLLPGRISLDDAKSLLRGLRAIRGYHRLHPGSGFEPEKHAKLQRQLLLRVIAGLLADPDAQADPRMQAQLREFIQAAIDGHPGLNDLDELQKLLADNHYFKENDFPALRLKTMIFYGKKDYAEVVSEIESLRKGISFVKKEQAADYTDILLMLADSYYSTKLLTSAEEVALELYENQPDNPDILWRVLRVQKILGDEGAPDPVLDEKLAVVENSRFVTIAKPNAAFDVYLFNQPEIEIAVDPVLRAQLKDGQLVQVFIEGKIAFENYVEGLPEKVVIGPPFVEIESKVRVQVSVL